MKPMDDTHLAILRRHMVEVIDMHYDLAEEELGRSALPPHLREALMETPRHLFVPPQLAAMAYQDTPLPIGFDKTVSQPFIAALMIDLLDVKAGRRVLEVGTGLGYQAALLAAMGVELWTVEVVEEFAAGAALRLEALGRGNITIRVGDGSRGWPDEAPFDRILVTAAAKELPDALVEQLAPGGTIVAPIGSGEVQQLCIVTKREDGGLDVQEIMPVRFTRLET
jgi:protein-L-isoaspartate(D-aspartate) O-methyltransferase